MKSLLVLFIIHLLSPGPSFFFLIMNSLSKGRKYGAALARGISTADLIFATVAAFAFLLLSQYENSPVLGYLMMAGGAWFIWKAIEAIRKARKHQLHNLTEASQALAEESFSVEAKLLERQAQGINTPTQIANQLTRLEVKKSVESQFGSDPILVNSTVNSENMSSLYGYPNVPVDNINTALDISAEKAVENLQNPEIKISGQNQSVSLLEGYTSGFKAGLFNIQAIMFFLALAIAGGIEKFTIQDKLMWVGAIAVLSFLIRQSIAWFFTTPKIELFFEKRQVFIQTVFSLVMMGFGANIIHNAYLFLKLHGHA